MELSTPIQLHSTPLTFLNLNLELTSGNSRVLVEAGRRSRRRRRRRVPVGGEGGVGSGVVEVLLAGRQGVRQGSGRHGHQAGGHLQVRRVHVVLVKPVGREKEKRRLLGAGK